MEIIEFNDIMSFCIWVGKKDVINSNEKLSSQIQIAEDRRNEEQIDADIVWKTQVERLQSIRKLTADFISASYGFMRINDGEIYDEKLDELEKNKFLLLLHFSPDIINQQQEIALDICDSNTNYGKDEMIVALINSLFDRLKVYIINIYKYPGSNNKEFIEYRKSLKNDLELLTRAMQIYLQIEWFNTKQRKCDGCCIRV